MVDRVPSPRRSPHQQHARPPDAWPTPARFPRSLPVALPCVGVVVGTRALAAGDGAGKSKAGGAPPNASTTPLSRLLVASPYDLRIAWWIPMSTPPKSVTVSEFLGLGQVPTPRALRAGGLQQLPDAGSARTLPSVGCRRNLRRSSTRIDGGANRGLGAGPPQS